jgi:ribosome assembly protein 1
MHGSSAHGAVTFTIRATPLPEVITNFLQANVSIMRKWLHEGHVQNSQDLAEGEATTSEDEAIAEADSDSSQIPTVKYADFWPAFTTICTEAGGQWANLPARIVATGPHHAGPNLLVNGTKSGFSS